MPNCVRERCSRGFGSSQFELLSAATSPYQEPTLYGHLHFNPADLAWHPLMRHTLFFSFLWVLASALLSVESLSGAEISQLVTSTASYSGPARVSAGTARLGDADAFSTSLRYSWQNRASDEYGWSVGLWWERFGFGVTAGTPIPNTVQTLALELGNNWEFADRWSLRTSLRPGLQSDFDDISASDLNATALFALAYVQSTNLTWIAAVTVDPRRDIPAIGGLGVRWRFAENWTLSAVLPKPTVEYQLGSGWTTYAGGELVGGAWRVGESFGTRTGRPALNDQTITFREIRVGAGLSKLWTQNITVGIEAGWVIDRRFVYGKANLQLNGDGAPYVGITLSGRF